jgi:hypothetical protein
LTGGHLALVSSRFCYSEGRWLSDAELIQSVLKEYRRRAVEPAFRERLEAIEARGTSCCGVSTFWDGDYLHGPVVRGLMLVLGENVSVVTVNDDRIGLDVGVQRVNACGRILPND